MWYSITIFHFAISWQSYNVNPQYETDYLETSFISKIVSNLIIPTTAYNLLWLSSLAVSWGLVRRGATKTHHHHSCRNTKQKIVAAIPLTMGHSGSCSCTNGYFPKQQCWLVCLLLGRQLFRQSHLPLCSTDDDKTKTNFLINIVS